MEFILTLIINAFLGWIVDKSADAVWHWAMEKLCRDCQPEITEQLEKSDD